MTQKVKILIGVALLAVFLTGAFAVYGKLSKQVKPQNSMELAEGEGTILGTHNSSKRTKAPDFTITDKNGDSIRFSDLAARKKPIVLNFWASWCPPCKSEMPGFDKVFKEMGDKVEFMMVDLTDGQRETTEVGMQFVKDQGFSFPVYFDTQQEAAAAYGIQSIPTTLFIDKEGYIVTGVQGTIFEETLRKGIQLIQ